MVEEVPIYKWGSVKCILRIIVFRVKKSGTSIVVTFSFDGENDIPQSAYYTDRFINSTRTSHTVVESSC